MCTLAKSHVVVQGDGAVDFIPKLYYLFIVISQIVTHSKFLSMMANAGQVKPQWNFFQNNSRMINENSYSPTKEKITNY